MGKTKTQRLARVMQTESGAAYTTCLRVVQGKIDELIAAGVAPSAAIDEVAVMKPAELGLHEARR